MKYLILLLLLSSGAWADITAKDAAKLANTHIDTTYPSCISEINYRIKNYAKNGGKFLIIYPERYLPTVNCTKVVDQIVQNLNRRGFITKLDVLDVEHGHNTYALTISWDIK